ncbi:MAG TPA: ABC transporter permease [Dehalococcoidia bacterium]|nr:ABC transporter permease [Dehalococcoidia bacterium]
MRPTAFPRIQVLANGYPKTAVINFLRSPLLGTLLAFVALIGLWQLGSRHALVASPAQAVEQIREDFDSGILWPHLSATLRVLFQGYFIAILIAFPVGLFLGFYHAWRKVLEEVLYGVNAIPKLAWYPMLLLVFGITVNTQVAFVIIGSLFPILVNTMLGVREVRPIMVKVGRSFGLSFGQMMTKVFLPAITPSLVTGLRIGYSLAVLHALLAELIVAREGLGVLMWDAYGNLRIDTVYGLIVIVFAIAVGGNMLLWMFERKVRGRATLETTL